MNSGYRNSIAARDQPQYPGNHELEEWLTGIMRFNAAAMVCRANRRNPGLGGHISTYASTATLYEVALHHFLRAGDYAYWQGHASPGLYARAYVEERLDESDLDRFRQEAGRAGLSSYPHPRLMPDFWQFPTVSMGLGPLMSIYQARFLRYLEHRGLYDDTPPRRVWCFVGDGECDEPETRAGLSLASRAELSNLVFVINCNLQRLDGPVRGNYKLVRELEGLFAGCGWNVIKVLWSSAWDPLFESELGGQLQDRLDQMVDGDLQRIAAEPVDRLRAELFTDELADLIDGWSDDDVAELRWGGHDREKVYAAYDRATRKLEGPTVILAQTVKGYGLGTESGRAWNSTHKITDLDDDTLRALREQLDLPAANDPTEYFRPASDSAAGMYLRDRRKALGGPLPAGLQEAPAITIPDLTDVHERIADAANKPQATTMTVRTLLGSLLELDDFGDRLVPIVADEGRTFGLEGLFTKHGIYTPVGQRYEPVDSDSLQHYHEDKAGQFIEEGITEAGAMASFIAAGTAHATLGSPRIPIYLFYSMFGFQRVGDLIWAAADARARGFLLGCTAGRTTLSGEGLQHQDGHSQLLASSVPSVRAYDPAFDYEAAVIVEHGLREIAEDQKDVIYYLTLYNERLEMPPKPAGVDEGIIRGIYCLRGDPGHPADVQLLGSGVIVHELVKAADLLRDELGISADVYSVTSYKSLRADALEVERARRLDPGEPRETVIESALGASKGPFVLASDWISMVPDQITRFLPGPSTVLGTDGFGRSDTRENLRRLFEIDAPAIAFAATSALADQSIVSEQLRRQAHEAFVPDESNQPRKDLL